MENNNTIDKINVALLELLNTQRNYITNGHYTDEQKAFTTGIYTALETALFMQNDEHTHYTLGMCNGKYCITENNNNV